MAAAQCHCGNIMLTVAGIPNSVTSCNGSVCYKLGTLWVYYSPEQVKIDAQQPSKTYCWGDQMIEFHHCPECGCCTHYASTEKSERPKIAINARMLDDHQLTELTVRNFDGADSWKYLTD